MMPSKNIHIFCNIFYSYLFLFISADPFGYNCETSLTFTTPNNISVIYRDNLNSLLSTLSSNATNQNGFFNSTFGRDTERAYGLFLCRGDVSSYVCKKCVETATKDIVRLCPLRKEAVVCYDYCMLRYSDKNIFGVWNQYFVISSSDDRHNVTEPERFYKILAYLMNELTTRLVNHDRKRKKFATQEANFTVTQKVYALAQCTPDISSDICKACLSQAISNLPTSCKKSKSCRVILLNCFIWYEFFPFYDSKASAAPVLVQNTPPQIIISENDHRRIIAIIAVPVISIVLIIVGLIICCFTRKSKGKKGRSKDINEHSNAKSLHYEFGAIQDATNNFSLGNRIGRGGFGDVYKGKLPNGQEIAVKRLSQSSNQGGEEFKSEVLLVAKLQHRNLVKLLGFCLQGVERILIYEFVPNKSLDYYLFDHDERERRLNCEVRLKIIRGVGRGLLYLHEDCPLKIVHRDLKPSNILLDAEMNPKISDFGMARIFGAHQTQGNTIRVVGTYGYMSPEYVMYGQYSVKSDVFSFGVLMLEIVTGNKNSSFCESNDANDLLSYAWKHWKENTPLELIDSTLEDCYSRNELVRCIQIGLLCVQKDAHKRRTMGLVVLMLSCNSVTLPSPQRPAFFTRSITEIQPKEVTFDEYSSTYSSMYIVEESVKMTMTKDV